tara:strand:+ start:19 stop:204 length:186 start_codon:yes stop_codon:yes gene_type:complete
MAKLGGSKKQKARKRLINWCKLVEAGIIKYNTKRNKNAAMTAKYGVIINSYKQQKKRRRYD